MNEGELGDKYSLMKSLLFTSSELRISRVFSVAEKNIRF